MPRAPVPSSGERDAADLPRRKRQREPTGCGHPVEVAAEEVDGCHGVEAAGDRGGGRVGAHRDDPQFGSPGDRANTGDGDVGAVDRDASAGRWQGGICRRESSPRQAVAAEVLGQALRSAGLPAAGCREDGEACGDGGAEFLAAGDRDLVRGRLVAQRVQVDADRVVRAHKGERQLGAVADDFVFD
ncbi:MAG: hypothetical protein JWO01_2798 [Microbacteriaceae bacterium]|nr:hypothetical protein [Microbacteriaceae bacterium]